MQRNIFIPFTWLLLFIPLIGFGQCYTDVTGSAGITFQAIDAKTIAGGAAFIDIDNDTYEDIYLTGGDAADKLYLNNQNGTFSDITAIAGLTFLSGYKTYGIAAGDINNDGYDDLFITTYVNQPNILLKNNGDGTFQDISISSNIINDTTWSTSAVFGDYNLDGYIDLYVVNYLHNPNHLTSGLNASSGVANYFYLNNGDETFTKMDSIFGLNDNGSGLATTFTDFDMDQDMDIHVINDFGFAINPDLLYRNNFFMGPAPATDVAVAMNVDIGINGMGVAIGDYDEDGDFDYYVTNYGKNYFFNNLGSVFKDTAAFAGVNNQYADLANTKNATSWGTAFFDYDNDSYLDLFVANGAVEQVLIVQPKDPCKLYHNNQDGTFSDVSVSCGVNDSSRNRGVAYADFDNDGDLDILVNAINKTGSDTMYAVLFRNDIAGGNNWLKVQVAGTTSNRNGYGAKVYFHFNGRKLVREVDGGSSYLSRNSPVVHTGLGTSTIVDTLVVMWPRGNTDTLFNVNSNQLVSVNETPYLVNIDEEALTNAIHISPNPVQAGTELTITTKAFPVEVTVTTIDGKVIASRFLTTKKNTLTLNRSGIYFIRLTFGNNSVVEKVIVW